MNKKVKESIIDGDIILYVVDLSSKSIEYVDLNEEFIFNCRSFDQNIDQN